MDNIKPMTGEWTLSHQGMKPVLCEPCVTITYGHLKGALEAMVKTFRSENALTDVMSVPEVPAERAAEAGARFVWQYLRGEAFLDLAAETIHNPTKKD